MKILLVCAGGMSTSILMKKLEQYSADHNLGAEIKAVGLSAYQEEYKNFDIILMGPQVSYRKDEVQQKTGLPVEAIPSFDYAIGNAENIFKIANKLYATK